MVKPFTIETYKQLGNKPLTREDCIKHKIHYRNEEVPDCVYYSQNGSKWPLRSVHPDGYIVNASFEQSDSRYNLLIDVEDEIAEDMIIHFYISHEGKLPLFSIKLTSINLTTKQVKAEVI